MEADIRSKKKEEGILQIKVSGLLLFYKKKLVTEYIRKSNFILITRTRIRINMSTFKLIRKEFNDHMKNVLVRTIPISLIAISIPVLLSLQGESEHRGFPIVMTIVMFVIAGGIGIKNGIRLQKDAWDSFLIEIKDEVLVRTQKRIPELRLCINEITGIIESKAGIFLSTEKKKKAFFIPKQIEGYEEIKEYLKNFREIEKAKPSYNGFMIVISTIALLVLYFYHGSTQNLMLMMVSGVVLVALLLASVITIYKSKEVDSKIKRLLWVTFFPIGGLILRMLIYLYMYFTGAY